MKYPFLLVVSMVLVSCSITIPLTVVNNQMPAPDITPTPTALATIQDTTTITVKSEVLEVRSGPGENFGNVGYLDQGSTVEYYSISNTGDWCGTWYKIALYEERWVCGKWVSKS